MQPLTIGDCTITSIMEWTGPFADPARMMPLSTPEAVARHHGWMAPVHWDAGTGLLIMAFQSFLIRTPRKTILVDTCVGNHKERPARPNWHRQNWPWLDNLRAAGVTPEEIDLVLCTHLHVDHVGWNTRLVGGRWVPTFPNARYLIARTEYDDLVAHPHPAGPIYEDSVLPIVEAGKADLVDANHEIDDGLWLEHTPGHTVGHVCIHLKSGGMHAVFIGDMMHHPVQVPNPQWSTAFCRDPAQAAATRVSFLERHIDTPSWIIPAHFAGGTAGRVKSGGDQWRFDFHAA
ncbi:MAG: MBL fold metallo-hydrolase [Rhodospirillales bacterium]